MKNLLNLAKPNWHRQNGEEQENSSGRPVAVKHAAYKFIRINNLRSTLKQVQIKHFKGLLRILFFFKLDLRNGEYFKEVHLALHKKDHNAIKSGISSYRCSTNLDAAYLKLLGESKTH